MTDDAGRALTFDGSRIPFHDGQTVGGALMAAGITSWRTTRRAGEPRGLFCGIGVCFDCLVTVDGQHMQRACVTPAQDGQVVESTSPATAVSERGRHGA
ncbi:(2Fe-2S)-binding protein [Microbacterium indicum]|uniref:(2Fe-2S)-binding protein n=1 Tax=Microbacterium indicum TaxID=358100 RepID=UPI00041626AF|nr:(2Fe-2S)-binding protein [Microbacterium indicum]